MKRFFLFLTILLLGLCPLTSEVPQNANFIEWDAEDCGVPLGHCAIIPPPS